MADLDKITPGRVPPRECVRAARDALTKAYSAGGGRELWPFYLEAVDWLRRAAEQLVPQEHNCRFEYCTAPTGECEHPE